MSIYKALLVSEIGDKQFESAIVELDSADLPEGEVLISVQYSSLNYKDALSASGNKGVTRSYPHTPGVDAAGTVVESASPTLEPGAEVIVTGYDLGMNTMGGFGQLIRVPAAWVVPKPQGLSLRESMIIGTAGLTAALSIRKLLHCGLPKDGEVLVTGASGGVGSVAVALLARLGYDVVASTGKPDQSDWLLQLGANQIMDRAVLAEPVSRPLLPERWAGAVDVVGGATLFNVIKSLRHSASVAACGLVQSPMFEASVLPFILRGVNLLGVDSVEIPLAEKQAVWDLLATEWKLEGLEQLVTEIGFDELETNLQALLSGSARGRMLLRLAD